MPPIDLCILDHSYLLTSCPDIDTLPLDDWIEREPLDDRATYVLLQEILSALIELLDNGIAHGAVALEHIWVADLRPKTPAFWLTGWFAAGPMSNDQLESCHFADVNMAMETIAKARSKLTWFEDPVVNGILCELLQHKRISAEKLFEQLGEMTSGALVDFPFEVVPLRRNFTLTQFLRKNGRTEIFYRKIDLVAMGRAYFAHNVERCQKATQELLCMRPDPAFPNWDD